MSLKDDLEAEVSRIFRQVWTTGTATVVPAAEDLILNSNYAKHLPDAVVLYADIDGSTPMVDSLLWSVSTELYKAYLRCASSILKSQNGTITAYDGDRVMAVFIAGAKNTDAVRAALMINYAVEQIIRPSYAFYETGYVLKHVVGIDSSELHAARIGVRGDNDIVWVGRAANYAAKLCALSEKPVWITKAVYDKMLDEVKYVKGTNANVWTAHRWTPMQNMQIYSSDAHYVFV